MTNLFTLIAGRFSNTKTVNFARLSDRSDRELMRMGMNRAELRHIALSGLQFS